MNALQTTTTSSISSFEKIDEVVEGVKAGTFPGFFVIPEIDKLHGHLGNLYYRIFPMKAGQLVVGKIHKTAHLAVMLSGKILVKGEDGQGRIISSGWVGFGEPPCQRILFCLEDSNIMTVHVLPDEILAKDMSKKEWDDEISWATVADYKADLALTASKKV